MSYNFIQSLLHFYLLVKYPFLIKFDNDQMQDLELIMMKIASSYLLLHLNLFSNLETTYFYFH